MKTVAEILAPKLVTTPRSVDDILRATHVKTYTRTTKTGKQVTVAEHEDSRQADISSGRANESGNFGDHTEAAVAHQKAFETHMKLGDETGKTAHYKQAGIHAGKQSFHAMKAEEVRKHGRPLTEDQKAAMHEHQPASHHSDDAKKASEHAEKHDTAEAHSTAAGAHYQAKHQAEMAGNHDAAAEHEKQIKHHEARYNEHRAAATKATSQQQDQDAVRAAGTSEGVRKAWETRKGMHPSQLKYATAEALHQTLKQAANEEKSALPPYPHEGTEDEQLEHAGKEVAIENKHGVWDAFDAKNKAEKELHQAARAHMERQPVYQNSAEKEKLNDVWEKAWKNPVHRAKMTDIAMRLNFNDGVQASDTTPDDAVTARASDVVHCRAASDILGPVTASDKPWKQGEEVEFMYMPAGQHTICAGFRGQSILLTVNIDPERDSQVVQASFQKLVSKYPKQKPFGCIEHEEKDASVWAKGFNAKADGIYLAAEPSALGENHVNGRIHRSWSPSFLTDADYKKATLVEYPSGKVYEFPAGVRGSEQNPARITGVTFCVGTLTNNPAFKEINPVRAKEMATVMIEKDKVTAGAPVGNKNAVGHHGADKSELHKEYKQNEEDNYHSENAHLLAHHFGSDEEREIAKNYVKLHKKMGEATRSGIAFQGEMSQKYYQHIAPSVRATSTEATPDKVTATKQPRTVDAILAGAKPGNQNAAGPHQHLETDSSGKVNKVTAHAGKVSVDEILKKSSCNPKGE